MEETIISLERVSKRFESVDAVRDVSLAVRRGEFVSLLGPSGCGKSTILRMIAGFEQPDSGAIAIDGTDMLDVPANRRPVNMVFQSYALFPHLTVFDNVAFGPRRKRAPHDEIPGRVERFLQLVGLEGLGGRYPSQLSGGQQQRVALARALVNQPQVLLLDEPLGALDLKLRKRMQVELKQLQREIGISFIYVTHDQDEALALSDRIAVMNAGSLLQYGPAREIYDRPHSEFVANFLGEANILRGTVVAARATGVVVDVAGHRVVAPDAGDVAARTGEPALIAVRPEYLMIADGASGAENVLDCRIEDKVFLGSSFAVYLRVGDCALTARGVDRAIFDALAPGAQVQVGWRTEMSRLVVP